MTRPPRAAYVGIFVLALSVLLFQVALTRVFAIMMWHHLTYMVVSIALLGFGAAGSLLTARAEGVSDADPRGAIAGWTAGYAVSVLVAFVAVTFIPVDSIRLLEDWTNLGSLLAVYGVLSLPFLCAGAAIGLVLTHFAQDVNRLYFADLVGSALGGAASVAALSALGGTSTVVLAALLGGAAAVAFSLAAEGRARLASWGATALTALALAFSTGLVPGLAWTPPFAPGKEFSKLPEGAEIDRIASSTAEVEIAPEETHVPALGGDVGWPSRAAVPSRLVGQDGTAPTVLFRGAADVGSFPFLRETQAASAYVAHAARGGSDPRVLVIGVGGGVDVMKALAFGASDVTAVEINRAMIEMVTERYDDYLGGLFREGAHPLADRIRLVHGEGRSFVRAGDERFDVIQMSGVDSFTALNTGAYTLSESYLYTVDAVKEFYGHLNEGGYCNYSRFILSPGHKARETLRLANICATALRELGVEEPGRSIAVLQGEAWASTIVKRGTFTAVEVDALEELAHRQGYLGLVFDPLPEREGARASTELIVRSDAVRQQLGGALHASVLASASGPELRAAVDALSPAVAAAARGDAALRELLVARYVDEAGLEPADVWQQQLAALADASAAGVVTPLAEAFESTRDDYRALLWGDAAERAAFHASYEYDVTACRDDRPFFFNYYTWGALFERLFAGETATGGGPLYHSDFPVGHAVLLASLVQIVLLAALLIFLPLRPLAKKGLGAPGAWRFFGYFAALGMGFMFLEIVLIQKLVIFLGHPTYAMSVVLASLLGFAGLGSFLAGRFRSTGRPTLLRLVAAIAVAILATIGFLELGLPALLGLPLPARIACTVAALCPLGLLLGMPFPTGMRIAKERAPQLLPWCWAINGFLSVFSSVFAIVLSMMIGFTGVLVCSALVYVAGFLVMVPGDAEPQAS